MHRIIVVASLLAALLAGAQTMSEASTVTFSPISSFAFDTNAGGGAVNTAFLPNGKLLVDDSSAGQITEMNPDGSDETVFAAGLNNPRGIAVDPVHGFVYVADAGDGSYGSDALVRFTLDGGGETSFNANGQPLEVSVDSSGDVLVAVNGTGDIEEMQFDFANGSLTSVTSIGPDAPNSNLEYPSSIAISPAGDIYIGEYASIYVLPSGSSTWVSLNTTSEAPDPTALAFSNGNLLVSYNTFEGDNIPVSPLVAFPIVGSGATQTLGTPTTIDSLGPDSITVAPGGISGVTAGSLFLGGQFNNVLSASPNTDLASVLESSADGSTVTPIAFCGSSATRYTALTYDAHAGTLLAVDQALGTVTSMRPDGSGQHVVISGYGGNAVGNAEYLAADPSTGTIFVSDSRGGVESYPANGGTVATGTVLSSSTFPTDVSGIAVLGSKLFVASQSSVYAGAENGSGFAQIEPLYSSLRGLAGGPDGDVYAALNGGSIARFAPTGGKVDFLPLPGRSPTYVAVDSSGRVFAADDSLSPGNLEEVSSSGLGPQQVAFSSGTIGVASDGPGVFTSDDLTIESVAMPPLPIVSTLSTHAALRGSSTKLTITGSNLDGAVDVEFEKGASASYFATPETSTSTSVTVVVPSMSVGTYVVSVVTPGGASSASTGTTFVVYSDSPTIKAISPDSGPKKGGQRVTISGTLLAHAISVKFGGVTILGSHLLKDTATSIVLRTPAHSVGTVTVTVITKAGRSPGAKYHYLLN